VLEFKSRILNVVLNGLVKSLKALREYGEDIMQRIAKWHTSWSSPRTNLNVLRYAGKAEMHVQILDLAWRAAKPPKDVESVLVSQQGSFKHTSENGNPSA
jgi:hypothetical protein